MHLFRNLISRVRVNGGEVLAATREKDVTVSLCQHFGIPQIVLSKAYTGRFLTGIGELIIRTLGLLRVALKFKPHALVGTSMSIGLVGRLVGSPSFVFSEDDADVVPLFAKIAYPTCNYVITPECLSYEDYGSKHLTYPGYHELAYLHPDHFAPDFRVLRSVGLKPDMPYFILRFVALKAHHDTRARGFSAELAEKLLDILKPHGKVLITSEDVLPHDFSQYQFPLSPEKFHDVLAFAAMCISDSQTVTAEAAVLGIPNIRANTFVRRITYLKELEKKYGLTKGFLPHETDNLICEAQGYLEDAENVRHDFQHKRNKMLQQCVNLADWQWKMLTEKIFLSKE